MDYQIDKLINFCLVTDRMNSNEYKDRGQNNKFRRLQQNFSGKAGELFVNDYLKMGQEEYVLEILPNGQLRSDIKWQGKGFGIKTQDESSLKQWGSNRYVFHSNDKFKSDVYCGIQIRYQQSLKKVLEYASKRMIGESNPEQQFKDWVESIEYINCSWGFCCNRKWLVDDLQIGDSKIIDFKDNIWTDAGYGLKKKKVLLAEKLELKTRIDLRDNFPRPQPVCLEVLGETEG